MPRQRLFAAALAALGAVTLLLQLRLTLHNASATGLTAGQALWQYFGYFTILSNALVVLALMAWAIGPRSASSRFLRRVDVQTAVAVAIVIVAVVYHLLLRNLWQPHGWQWLADQLLHTAMPVLFMLHWWLAVPKAALRFRHVLTCLPYPVAYAAYAVVRGAADGWYPYPFIDVTALGYPRVAVNALGLLAAFVVVAFVLVGLGRWQVRGLRVTSNLE
ncbi:MAG TPA: Pr6Pr family membrane protein [Rhodanobacteraceae bacterium]|jgi:hypothetical protein|nr:Pr6Pr family membrane protein [Rhodanobacteraceae bacterium]